MLRAVARFGRGLGVFVLSACALTPANDSASRRHHLTLHQALSVAAHRATVTLQGARVTAPAELNRFQPHCVLEVRNVRAVSQELKTDRFTITSINYKVEHFATRPRQLAGAGLLADATPTYMMWVTEFRLHSAQQPQVMRLRCHHLEDPASLPRHLQGDEMRKALGGVITFG